MLHSLALVLFVAEVPVRLLILLCAEEVAAVEPSADETGCIDVDGDANTTHLTSPMLL
jgi:hypothetical protein